MEIVSWPVGVNRIITSESSITVGQDAVSKDNSENGSEMTGLKSSGAPDQFSVVMYFSNSTKDSFFNNHMDASGNHITEWQSFLNWFKYTTMMGQKPFYFHKIDDPRDDIVGNSCAYKIMSSGLPKGIPEGTYYKVTMTWGQVFLDAISISRTGDSLVDSIYVRNGMMDIRFSEKPSSSIKKADFIVKSDYYQDEYVPVLGLDYDGNKTAVLYFDSFNIPGIYTISVEYDDKILDARLQVTAEDEM